MSKSLWNLAKVSPFAFGITLALANVSIASQPTNPEAISTQASALTLNSSVDVKSTNVSEVTISAQPVTLATNIDFSRDLAITNPTPASQTPEATVASQPDAEQTLQSIERYNNEMDSMGQVTSITQLRDVSPRAWAFEALRSLVERYQCIAGYPDGTFRGDRAMTRFEFAAGLNACLRRIEALVGTGGVTREDLEAIRRLTAEFRTELTALGTRVNALDGRVRLLEQRQFSTTTRLRGEVIFSLSNVFGDAAALPDGRVQPNPAPKLPANNTVFSDRVRLNLNSSFTGQDLLITRLQARNIVPYSGSATTGTAMTRLSYDGNESNAFNMTLLQYQFPIGDGRAYLSTVGSAGVDDADVTLSPTGSSGSGAISRFGRYNPIFNQATDTGLTIDYPLIPNFLRFTTSYQVPSSDASNPSRGSGLFSGQYYAQGNLLFTPSRDIGIGLTYINSYLAGSGNVSSSSGSANANRPFGSDRTTANYYAVQARFRVSPGFTLAGWVGYTYAINESNKFQRAEIWNYAVQAAFPDFGGRGNLLGIIAGMPPRAGFIRGRSARDVNGSFHLEGFYRIRVNDNISVTPGVFVIFNPEHNRNNPTQYVGAIRTTFSF